MAFDYSEEDLKDLISYIGDTVTFQELFDFLKSHLDKGSFKFGVKEKGSQGSAGFITELQNYYPDVYRALFQIQDKDLPLSLNELHEGIVAYWRYSKVLA